MILLKRAYEPTSPQDGRRLLVERLWPRGVKTTNLPLDGWPCRSRSAMSFANGMATTSRGESFVTRYRDELDQQSDAFQKLLKAARASTITFITATRDLEHSNTAILKQFLEQAA